MEAARKTERAQLAESYRAVAHVYTRCARDAKRAERIDQYLAYRATVVHAIVRARQIERAAA